MTDESLTEKVTRLWEAATDSAETRRHDRGIMNAVRLVGAGLVMTLVIVLVLTEVHAAIPFETGPNGSYTGPFGDVVATLESTGVAALSLLVVGFIVVAASTIMRYFGGGFGGR
jgi:hypothetical protein